MKILGLDIGTTTISAVVMEEGTVLKSLTRSNGKFLLNCQPWEKLQDPDAIRETALQMTEELFLAYPDIAHIGLTGQMHGILYLNRAGQPVSPLYTWQDGRGDLVCEEVGAQKKTYAACLQELTGYEVYTGYGMTTHYYHVKNGLVPADAAVFCTIQDYLAMVLCGEKTPVIDVSDAASLGLFDVKRGCFDPEALKKAGIDPTLLPGLADSPCIGCYEKKAKVYAAIGDNQASFLGAVGGCLQRMLVNVGTGSQFSVYSPSYMTCPGLETRPFPGGGYLLVGASLCGGRAYALLERFFWLTAGMLQEKNTENASFDCYRAMAKLLESRPRPENLPRVTPLFQGTRQAPDLRGSIENLDTENFTPLHLIWAFMQGMAEELYQMYEQYLAAGGQKAPLTGSGNGLRKNPRLRECFAETFGQPLELSDCREEAACGAAGFVASCAGEGGKMV